MKHKLSRISMVLSASGMLAVGLSSAAYAATTASTASTATASTAPAWHTVLSVSNGATQNRFETIIATGRTTGWAFLENGTFAYERTGATTWKKVPFPATNGFF